MSCCAKPSEDQSAKGKAWRKEKSAPHLSPTNPRPAGISQPLIQSAISSIMQGFSEMVASVPNESDGRGKSTAAQPAASRNAHQSGNQLAESVLSPTVTTTRI